MSKIKKAAIVTGGSGGIGSAVCKALAEQGWLTAVFYNSDEKGASAVVDEITSKKYTAKAFQCDISDINSIRNAVEAVRKEYGEIGLLVNNSGIADIGLFTDMSDERLTRMINVDLLGAMRITKEVIPDMIRSHEGAVINISSVWGECGASCEVAYSAAKAGLIGFTKALAKECAPSNVRVNCISCGLIDTKMNACFSQDELNEVVDDIPSGRMGTPEDIANGVLFLSDEKSSYIQGQILRIDGGWI